MTENETDFGIGDRLRAEQGYDIAMNDAPVLFLADGLSVKKLLCDRAPFAVQSVSVV